MSFLRRSQRITPLEARKIVELHELVQHSLLHGPVTLDLYAQVARLKTSAVESRERSARRLVANLAELGYRVEVVGDAAKLTLDFGSDEALRAELERWIDRALLKRGAPQEVDDEEENESVQLPMAPIDSIKADYTLGLAVAHLCRRYRIDATRMQALLRALKLIARAEGRPTVERRRSVRVVEEAIALGGGPFETKDGRRGSPSYGRVAAVSRILGCHRNTAREFLRRFDRLRARQSDGP